MPSSNKKRSPSPKSKKTLSKTYRHTYAFVKTNIVPEDLSKIEKCVEVYLKKLLVALKHPNKYDGLSSLIFSISPFPPYTEISADFDNVSSAIVNPSVVRELAEALENDGIQTDIAIEDEY